MIYAPQGYLAVELIEEETQDNGKLVQTSLAKQTIKAIVLDVALPRLTTEVEPAFAVGDTVYLDKDAPFISVEGTTMVRHSAVLGFKTF